jgi:hypothetical protein
MQWRFQRKAELDFAVVAAEFLPSSSLKAEIRTVASFCLSQIIH